MCVSANTLCANENSKYICHTLRSYYFNRNIIPFLIITWLITSPRFHLRDFRLYRTPHVVRLFHTTRSTFVIDRGYNASACTRSEFLRRDIPHSFMSLPLAISPRMYSYEFISRPLRVLLNVSEMHRDRCHPRLPWSRQLDIFSLRLRQHMFPCLCPSKCRRALIFMNV
jgi:hypothetical protein